MYEENRRFSWTNFLIKAIIIVIFVLFVTWLLSLSTKGLSNSLNVLTDNVTNENIERMKEVGREYFTIERLPSEIGATEKITLKEMYEKNLILEVKDKNGKACSAENSYVSVKKLDSEYEMKVYLECGDEENYIISIMGCNDLCGSDSCAVKKEEPKEDEDNKVVKPVSKTKEYQYVLKTEGKWGEYGAWSEWTTTKIEGSLEKQVQVKTENQAYTYVENVQKTNNYNYLISSTCPSGYTYNGTNCTKTTTLTTAVTKTCPSGYTLNGTNCTKQVTSTSEKYLYTKTFTSRPSNTSKYRYEYVSQKDELSCTDSCKKVTIFTYKVYEKVSNTNTSTTSVTLTCPTGYTYNGSQCAQTSTSTVAATINKTCPSGTYEKADKTGCYNITTTPVTKTGYREITTYRYRTRTYIEGTTIYKWSKSKTDQTLLNAGYKLTGKTR